MPITLAYWKVIINLKLLRYRMFIWFSWAFKYLLLTLDRPNSTQTCKNYTTTTTYQYNLKNTLTGLPLRTGPLKTMLKSNSSIGNGDIKDCSSNLKKFPPVLATLNWVIPSKVGRISLTDSFHTIIEFSATF